MQIGLSFIFHVAGPPDEHFCSECKCDIIIRDISHSRHDACEAFFASVSSYAGLTLMLLIERKQLQFERRKSKNLSKFDFF